ncbi:ExbD/TolR family protein [Hydrogenophaga sp. PBL-H3]|uniref:ExbD/TolR family protein n=1 Tax=Hydrogenophaga sp. PBL-H3 TaxID=434010 RepID=UPI001320384A|nr:biopolymer transporter ExbD [Hydrogenophaga sp. PBL-H3]QHE74847.1 biopolymer transporter ExbD [Hydrogenophaga sp. PBL-H3]QHE79274.1 biopolymer transporter ExbD [Hydrogenophaga sp. PBL-H3]
MSFGRLEKPTSHKPMSEINVTPLVDVMLVLLVIFIIAAPFMADRLALQLPKAELPKAATPVQPGPFVSLAIDGQGQMQWNGQAVDEVALRQRLLEAAQRDPATEVQLRADASVPYGRVVSLIGMAQSAGLSRIGFVAESAAPR